jgi:hypothetical protein
MIDETNKVRIVGSEFSDVDLTFDVCSHLRPILQVLEDHGNKYDHSKPLYRDKYSEAKRVMDRPIDFDLIENTFIVPHFVLLSRPKAVILCQMCWCSIVEKA